LESVLYRRSSTDEDGCRSAATGIAADLLHRAKSWWNPAGASRVRRLFVVGTSTANPSFWRRLLFTNWTAAQVGQRYLPVIPRLTDRQGAGKSSEVVALSRGGQGLAAWVLVGDGAPVRALCCARSVEDELASLPTRKESAWRAKGVAAALVVRSPKYSPGGIYATFWTLSIVIHRSGFI